MKKIQVRMEYDDLFVEAYLLDSNKDAIYLDESLVWIAGIKPLDKIGKYYLKEDGVIISDIHNKENVSIEMIVEKMKTISLYEYIINHFDRTHDINFDILGLIK